MLGLDLTERGDVLLRDQQDVCRRRGVDVAEREDRVGLVHDVSRRFLVDAAQQDAGKLRTRTKANALRGGQVYG